jgi:hypothetical protein
MSQTLTLLNALFVKKAADHGYKPAQMVPMICPNTAHSWAKSIIKGEKILGLTILPNNKVTPILR